MSGVLRYEWRRITSIRSTWILLALGIVLSGAFAFLITLVLGAAENSPPPNGQAADALDISITTAVTQSVSNFIVLVALGTVAAQAFGQEYRHGTIRLTLTEFPRRTGVFFGKIIICCLFITVAFLISTVLAYAIIKSGGAEVSDISTPDLISYVFRSWLNMMGFCLIVFAITVLTRILALGVVIPLIFAVVFEGLLQAILGNYAPWVAKVLPFTAGSNFADGTDMLRNGLVYGAWVAVLTAVAYVVFTRRDA